MSNNNSQLLCRLVFLIAIAAVYAAKLPHGFGDGAQESDSADGGLTALQLQLLAQQLADDSLQYNAPQFASNWDRIIRTPQIKRQNRYRQCYFNPVSCFRK